MPAPTLAAARYRQVKEFILQQIGDGRLETGARVPSENDLVRALDVARMTANRALRELAEEGVLVRVAGVGTFVAERRVHSHPLEIHNIADEIRERGHAYSVKVLCAASANASEELAERCGVAAGTRLERSLLVHYESGIPLQVEDRYVNPAVVPGYLRNDFSRTTPHEFLMRAAPLQRAEHTVRAVRPAARIRRMLKLGESEACLLIRRRTWAARRIATIADLFHPGSRYELTGTFQGADGAVARNPAGDPRAR